jgi:hypothetical protein
MSLSERKYRLITQLTQVYDEKKIATLEALFVDEAPDEILAKLAKPMRKSVTVEELAREQNYKGIESDEFQRIIERLDIQEPLDELLAGLTP